MKLLSGNKIFELSFMLIATFLVLDTSLFYGGAFGQINSDNKKYDIVLLNQSYISERLFADEIDGEILNNGTATIKAVEITAILYDDQDDIVGNERSGTSPYTINPGDRATFNMEILDDMIKSTATSYDFTAKWKDEYLFSSYFTRLTGDEISADDGTGKEEEADDDDNDDDINI